jgi:hypothetical protein
MLVMEKYTSDPVGTNLANGKTWAKSNRKRQIVRMALVGGAAARDAAVDISYGTEQVAHLENFQTGAPDKTKLLWNTTKLYIPPQVPINVEVTDAFSSTPTFLILDIKNVR